MRIIAFFFLLIGTGLAGSAVYYMSIYVQVLEDRPTVNHINKTMVHLVAAREALSSDDRLDYEAAQELLKFVEWPSDAVPDGAFFNSEELFGADKDEVRYVLRRIDAGDLILRTKVTGFGERRDLKYILSPGMVALPIPINAVSGGGGHIVPGDNVDIDWTRAGEDGNMSTVVLLRNVKVVAIDQSTDTERSGAQVARTVTVEVNQKDAQKLRLAMQAGNLALLLRSAGDELSDGSDALPPLDLDKLLGKSEPEPQAEPEAKPEKNCISVRRGGVKTTEDCF